ncbi:RING zinc finger protein, putative [Brugia malayi]|uniref:RING-type E3 ubiquitin transferase n=2 Tax=Brugia TaxID=6278 RepID=A0A0K0JCN3_BRUMA|nr:RING zinc finger protein, putative [Brugia malayi]CRZ23793.1 Bm3978 [Brugia malayi]VDO37635.1 unnamed protein product [Brugia timori]VIO90705.1 RING zinc finger protein, putative [Brugia malayi]
MATSEKRRECRRESRNSTSDEDDSRYECSICYKEAVNPVVLSCGHFYCWECIDEWLNKYAHENKQCPICKMHVRDGGIIPIYGKGLVKYCENPRPSARALNLKDDKDDSPTGAIKWRDFFKVSAIVAGLVGSFMLGKQVAKRKQKN